jgi:hypothetical protein
MFRDVDAPNLIERCAPMHSIWLWSAQGNVIHSGALLKAIYIQHSVQHMLLASTQRRSETMSDSNRSALKWMNGSAPKTEYE